MRYLIIFLFLCSNAISEEVNFICKNKNGREPSFALKIDLKNKTMNGKLGNYKINSTTENKLFASRKYKYGNDAGEIVLTFDRMTGDLLYRNFRNGLKFDFADFACKKAGKKLI